MTKKAAAKAKAPTRSAKAPARNKFRQDHELVKVTVQDDGITMASFHPLLRPAHDAGFGDRFTAMVMKAIVGTDGVDAFRDQSRKARAHDLLTITARKEDGNIVAWFHSGLSDAVAAGFGQQIVALVMKAISGEDGLSDYLAMNLDSLQAGSTTH
jgi:hypothetical protein